jgi:hypothetical protein
MQWSMGDRTFLDCLDNQLLIFHNFYFDQLWMLLSPRPAPMLTRLTDSRGTSPLRASSSGIRKSPSEDLHFIRSLAISGWRQLEAAERDSEGWPQALSKP